jgi:hypothetical protein
MCGLFGAIGKGINPGTIRALAIANRERGTHGTGFFDSSGKFVKVGKDAMDALSLRDFAAFIKHSKRWFLAGHTRHRTWGKISNRNAHPFRYGSIIGSHNGMVSAPGRYKVDSEYLIDRLNKTGGDYQSAHAEISGYWALTWFDGDSFYIGAHDNEVYLGRASDGVWYYSSEKAHLEACADVSKPECIWGGRVIRFRAGCDMYDELPEFISLAYRREKPKTRVKVRYADSTDIPQWSDLDYYDALAKEAGYTDFDTLCEVESMGDRAAAMTMLDDLFYYGRATREAASYSDYWNDYTEGWD